MFATNEPISSWAAVPWTGRRVCGQLGGQGRIDICLGLVSGTSLSDINLNLSPREPRRRFNLFSPEASLKYPPSSQSKISLAFDRHSLFRGYSPIEADGGPRTGAIPIQPPPHKPVLTCPREIADGKRSKSNNHKQNPNDQRKQERKKLLPIRDAAVPQRLSIHTRALLKLCWKVFS